MRKKLEHFDAFLGSVKTVTLQWTGLLILILVIPVSLLIEKLVDGTLGDTLSLIWFVLAIVLGEALFLYGRRKD